MGLGPVVGSGRQPFPWIHIDDVVGILLFLIDRGDLHGRFNAVSPGIVSHETFIRAFARQLRRPITWRAPAWLVERVFGRERSSILLQGQLVRPKRTFAAGYRFRLSDLEAALQDLVRISV